MSVSTFFGFIVLSLIVCSSPGPSMFFVILQGLSKNWKNVVAGIAGLIAANLIWTLFCAFGIGALIQNSQYLFHQLKILGVLYLIYLGISTLYHSNRSHHLKLPEKPASIGRVFLKGFLTSISNPKALLFYMAFLPQFASGRIPYHHEILVLGVCYLMVVMVVMSFYGIMATRIAHTFDNPVFHRTLKRMMGICFLGFGVSLLRYEQ